jgi:hypothetical protein
MGPTMCSLDERVTFARSWRAHPLVLFAVCLTGLHLFPIWLVEFPPLQDYPYHLLRQHIILNYSNPWFNYETPFIIKNFPFPYSLVDIVVSVLSHVFSLYVSSKILLSVYVILFPLSIFYFISSVDRTKTVAGFFSFLLIFNWYFHKGFTSFIFSLPLYFFALGYWSSHKHRLLWKDVCILSVLILLVYLTHLLTFMIMLLTLTLLLCERPTARKFFLIALAVAPAGILLALSPFYNSPTYTDASTPFVLLYSDLGHRMSLLFGKNLTYFVSFSLTYERIIFQVFWVIVFALVMLNLRHFHNRIFLIISFVFLLLYFLLPEHISDLNYVANRLIIFIPIFLLLYLRIPTRPLYRIMLLSAVCMLTTLYLGLTMKNYFSINRQLLHYYEASRQLPPNQSVYFNTDRELLYIGQISPFVLFDAYYRIECGAQTIPRPIMGFVGPMRLVQMRHPIDRPMDDISAYPHMLTRVPPGGYALIFASLTDAQTAGLVERYDLQPVLALSPLHVYRKDKAIPFRSPYRRPIHGTLDQAADVYDYLLLYQAPKRIDPWVTARYDHVFSAGLAHVFRRKNLPEAALSEEKRTPCKPRHNYLSASGE